jgi:hypothetical protein
MQMEACQLGRYIRWRERRLAVNLLPSNKETI